MKAIKLSMLATAMLTAGISSVKAQTADEILEKHAKAVGGTANWDKIKTVTKTGSMSVQGMDVAITQTLVTNKGMRIDLAVMGLTGYQILTPTAGYALNPGTTKIDTLKGDALKDINDKFDEKKIQLLDYKEYAGRGTKTEFAGKDSVDNALCYKVKVTDKEGNESTSYFDAKTYFLVRTEAKVKKDDGESEATASFKDYKSIGDGIMMPMTVGTAMGEIAFKSIELNKSVDDNIFVPTPAK